MNILLRTILLRRLWGAGLIIWGVSGCSLIGPHEKRDDTVAVFPREEGFFGDVDPADEARTALAAVKAEAVSDRARTLEEFFRKGDYKQALEMAEDLENLSERGSEDSDVAGFISGVSLYHLGFHDRAERVLAAHVESFPESRHGESALFYRGSNLVRLQQWRSAAGVLDRFLARYPESILNEFALIDRAECHLALGEPDRALERCRAIERQFVYSKILDRAMAMEGEILEALGEGAKAEDAYVEAAQIARKLDHPRSLATSLAGLIRVTGMRGDFKASAAYYETFFETFAKSPEAVEAALAGLPAMRERGELKAGLGRLEQALLAMPGDAPALDMRKALRGYADYYRDANDPEKLLRKFDDLSSRTGGAQRLHEQVVVARLEALEANFPERDAEIRVFYEEIRSHFNRDDLSAETLVKLGRHASLTDLEDAESILEAALIRGGSDSRDLATLELAKVRAAMPDSAKQQLSIVGFRDVLDVYGKPGLAEQATLELARLYSRREDWLNARVFWKAYVRNTAWSEARPEAVKQLAFAESHAGPEPEPAIEPMVAETPSRPAKGFFERGYFRASALVEAGNRRGAYETLNGLLDAIDEAEVKELKGEEKRAYRRAASLHLDLGVELGLGAVD